MNLPRPVPIDLLDFLGTGRFECVELGATQEWLRWNFPDSDDGSVDGNIWRFGTIEFHFAGDVLDMIFMGDLRAGPGIELDPWLLSDRTTLAEVAQELVRLGVAATTRPGRVEGQMEIVFEDSGARLGFVSPTELEGLDPNQWPLAGFWLSRSAAG